MMIERPDKKTLSITANVDRDIQEAITQLQTETNKTVTINGVSLLEVVDE